MAGHQEDMASRGPWGKLEEIVGRREEMASGGTSSWRWRPKRELKEEGGVGGERERKRAREPSVWGGKEEGGVGGK